MTLDTSTQLQQPATLKLTKNFELKKRKEKELKMDHSFCVYVKHSKLCSGNFPLTYPIGVYLGFIKLLLLNEI